MNRPQRRHRTPHTPWVQQPPELPGLISDVLADIRRRSDRGEYFDDLWTYMVEEDYLTRAAIRRIRRISKYGRSKNPVLLDVHAQADRIGHNEKLLHEEITKIMLRLWDGYSFSWPRFIKVRGRRIGIRNLQDQILEQALADLLVAVFEPYFCGCSYGYRPNRDGIAAERDLVCELLTTKYDSVFVGDIEHCFQRIPIQPVMDKIESKIGDRRIRRLIGEVMNKGYEDREKGLVQGTVSAPILVNIFLTDLDRCLLPLYSSTTGHTVGPWMDGPHHHRPHLPAALHIVRYADDIRGLVGGGREMAHELRDGCEAWLARWGMRLKEQKTWIQDWTQPLDFLGFAIRISEGPPPNAAIQISNKANERLLNKLVESLQDPVNARSPRRARREFRDTHLNYYMRGGVKNLHGFFSEAERRYRLAAGPIVAPDGSPEPSKSASS